jgi:hypothetical protein
MSMMKNLWEDVNYLLDTTKWSCEEISNYLKCPVYLVEDIVEERWNERIEA